MKFVAILLMFYGSISFAKYDTAIRLSVTGVAKDGEFKINGASAKLFKKFVEDQQIFEQYVFSGEELLAIETEINTNNQDDVKSDQENICFKGFYIPKLSIADRPNKLTKTACPK